MSEFIPGQRWQSTTEPELGIGRIEAVEGRQVVIAFPARDVVRRYATADPPLSRVQLSVGQPVRDEEGLSFTIEAVEEVDGLLVYCGDGQRLHETELHAELDASTPENRLQSLQVDPPASFDLRHSALQMRHQLLASPMRGLFGGRIRLFDHQLSIAYHACQRSRVRVLLSDEVGLGKTIEALLILHRMLLTGRVENALILVPPALVHQWLAEAYLRFNLVLRVMGSDTYEEGTIDVESEDLPEQLLDAQLFVCPLGIEVGQAFTETAWDIVLIDEAHHLQPDSGDFALAAQLAEGTDHLVLLSATPTRDGERAHFHRLALLDPARFHDYDAYAREMAHYRALAEVAETLGSDEPLDEASIALLEERLDTDPETLNDLDRPHRQQLLVRLLDLHGLGRVAFRNTRARIPGFPRRTHRHAALPDGAARAEREAFIAAQSASDEGSSLSQSDARIPWLQQLLQEHSDEKFLVLCSDRTRVEGLANALGMPQSRIARFHEGMGSIERDRQAAWFLDEEGPQLAISSPIGAEGRNFQVARHLVLFDLPPSADRLEQAIGRVDRIGQGFEVFLHTAAAPHTPQERLQRWYAEALGILSQPWHGAPALESRFAAELEAALLAEDDGPIDALVQRGRAYNDELIDELAHGRDRLLELNSFDAETAAQLQREIGQREAGAALETFMLDAFGRGGLDTEKIGPRSYAVRAGLEYHLPFPGFVGEEMGVTFDRDVALRHPERAFLSWDHPMVRDVLDGLIEGAPGNASIARMEGRTPGLLLEALFVAESTLDAHWRADRFLPPTPVRVVVDLQGAAVQMGDLSDRLQPVDSAQWAALDIPLDELLSGQVQAARQIAEDRAHAIADEARARMLEVLQPQAERLVELARIHPAVGESELAACRTELAALSEGLRGARVRLDALRWILVEAP